MGTRGLLGFRKNEQDKLTYNHYDSYPNCLGHTMVQFCKETSVEKLNEIFDNIVLVNGNDTPTKKQINECVKYYDDTVSTGSINEWYCLLRNAQGNPDVYKDGLKYMIDDNDFIKDSLFCEYAYIINLDTNCLEFWVGFQTEPYDGNRYGTETHDNMDKYYPCKMLAYYPLDTDKTVEEIVADMNKVAEEDYHD